MNGPSTWMPSAPGTRPLRFSRRRERCGEHVRRVGDDRRQESGHAGAAMRGGDRGDPLDGRIGVEQHAAAAVDLPIDEARAKHSAAEIDLLAAARPVLGWNERLDRAALDDQRAIVVQPFAVEQAARRRKPSLRGFPLRRHGAAREQDRAVRRIVERRLSRAAMSGSR